MSTRERKPVEPEEAYFCDICGGEIVGEPYEPECRWDENLHFHEECWHNSADWVEDCPATLFRDEMYGTHVEAVRNGKILVFVDGDEDDEAYCHICDDMAAVQEVANEIDRTSTDIIGVVVNGEFRSAHVEIKVVIDED